MNFFVADNNSIPGRFDPKIFISWFTQLNNDYSTTSLYRKNDVMNDVIDIANN